MLRVLFTFPLRYWFAIGLPVVFRLGGWCRRLQTGFLRPRPTQGTARPTLFFAYGTFTPCGPLFQKVLLKTVVPQRSPTTPAGTPAGLASSAFARHYSRNHFCFLLLRLLRCFSSAGSRLLSPRLRRGGLPHSDTGGSRVVCTSPPIFAACRVLRRLREPRHPPCALGPLPFLRRAGSPRARQPFQAPPSRPRRLRRGRPLPPLRFCSVLPSLVNELFVVEDKGFEPLTPSLQS